MQQPPQPVERQGASQSADVPQEGTRPQEAKSSQEHPLPRALRKAADLRQTRLDHQEHVRRLAENEAIKNVAQQVNANCQLLAATLQALVLQKLEVQKIQTPDVALLVVYTEPGMELRDEVLDQLMKLLKMPVIVLPKSMRVEGVKPETLEAAGWTRLGPRSLVDAEGKPLQP